MVFSKTWNQWTQKVKIALGTAQSAVSVTDLEKLLFESDLPANIVSQLIKKTKTAQYENKQATLQALADETVSILDKVPQAPIQLPKPACILLVGVNGAGKTTTAARLAHFYRKTGRNVLLGAADTFRAGAVEQLKTWGDRLNIEVVSQGPNADPASVVFEAWKKAKEQNALLIADTAGRIHTDAPLMDQLEKIRRIVARDDSGAPHETWLVLDGTNGQNAIAQSREFTKSAQVTGLIVTKLDGTAKGGGAVSASTEFNLPIRFLGVGEKENDLIEFDVQSFVKGFYGI